MVLPDSVGKHVLECRNPPEHAATEVDVFCAVVSPSAQGVQVPPAAVASAAHWPIGQAAQSVPA